MIFGAIIILTLIFLPNGLESLPGKIKPYLWKGGERLRQQPGDDKSLSGPSVAPESNKG
jgi:hypothetical protein